MMTIADRVEARIKRSKRDVFLREDFDDLGGYDQMAEPYAKCVKKVCF